MIEADTSWLTENFEPSREEADIPSSLLICLRCAAAVPRYGAAWHLRWHKELRGDGLSAHRARTRF